MPVKLNGSTSGYVQLQAAAVAANNTLTLPNSGTTLISDATLPATAPTNGQIPIGNGTTYVPATITAGSGISVTNGAGSISIASTVTTLSYDRQTFNASGTWNKPASGTYVQVQIWGSGGGGRAGLGGGGGGGYSCTTFLLSDILTSTVSVTINGGGAVNNAGGSITFGSYLTHAGGGGGSSYTVACAGYALTGASGRLSASSGITLIEGSSEFSNTLSLPVNINNGQYYFYLNQNTFAPASGGPSGQAGGVSVFGGNGGTGVTSSSAGVAPGGGGGGNGTTAGAGAIGRMIVTVF